MEYSYRPERRYDLNAENKNLIGLIKGNGGEATLAKVTLDDLINITRKF